MHDAVSGIALLEAVNLTLLFYFFLFCWGFFVCLFNSGCKIHSFHPTSSFKVTRICGMTLVRVPELPFEIKYFVVGPKSHSCSMSQ